MNKTTLEELKRKQAFSLEQKIAYSKMKIRMFMEHMEGKAYVSFSGGIDSTVLRHIVLQEFPDVPCVFSDTTNEHPEIIKFVRQTPNVTWVKPKISFKEVIEKHGFPIGSKKIARAITDLRNPTDKNFNTRNLKLTGYTKDGKYAPSWKLPKKWLKLIDAPFDTTGKCCDYLKKEPLKRYGRGTGRSPIMGTMAEESNMRTDSYLKTGCNSFESKKEQSTPISIWTQKDIWAYIEKYNVEYCSIYNDIEVGGVLVEGEITTGCGFCMFGLHLEKGQTRLHKLKYRRPKRYNYWMNKVKNNSVSFKEALDYAGIQTPADDNDFYKGLS